VMVAMVAMVAMERVYHKGQRGLTAASTDFRRMWKDPANPLRRITMSIEPSTADRGSAGLE
jgi:hypothetical protein